MEKLYQKDKDECLAARRRWRARVRHLIWWDEIKKAAVDFQERHGIFYEKKWFDCAKACNRAFDDLDEACKFCLYSSHREDCAQFRTCENFEPFYDESEYEPLLFADGY